MSGDSHSPAQLVVARWKRQFNALRDVRRRRGKRHNLHSPVDVVLISLLGMLCGCDDADEIADWASERSGLLSSWLQPVGTTVVDPARSSDHGRAYRNRRQDASRESSARRKRRDGASGERLVAP